MKKFLKFAGYGVGIIILALTAFFIYFNSTYPDVDPPKDINVEVTPERIIRGDYLANHVTLCTECHSQRDWSKYAGPIKPGTIGAGGESFTEDMGFPGNLYSPNITPAALGNWTDGEIIRAITCGVNKDGDALFPMMPYHSYNKMSEEDLFSIVAYLRSLEPVENEVPESNLNFPLNFIVKTMPIKSYEPKPDPDTSDILEYGKYLTTISACGDCHTQSDAGEPLPGMYMAGGVEFNLPAGTVTSTNLTPDIETGIGSWSKEQFIMRFKAYSKPEAQNIRVGENDFNTVMPIISYSGMNEKDLGAIYEYLRSVPPVNNQIVRFTPREE